MAWIKKKYTGTTSEFLDKLLKDIEEYVTDQSIHGKDAWTLIRSRPWPYGTVFKVPNYQENEYGYIALMRSNLRVGSSYWNWLKQPDVLRKTFVMNKRGLNLDFNTSFATNNGTVTFYSKTSTKVKVGTNPPRDPNGTPVYSTNYILGQTNQYRFSPQPEIFAQNADVLFFSMFKQYEEEFDWSELMGNERKDIKLKPLKYYANGQISPTLMEPPLYSGVGCPAIGYSPEFFTATKNECNQDDDTTRTVYIVKDKHRLTTVVHYLEHWDASSVGFFEAFDTQSEYAFPAMAIGGTSGVLPLTEVASYGTSYPSVEHGFMLDYTEKNSALSNGVATFPATWWDGTTKFLDNFMYSKVQAMLPDGNWQSFANFGIRQDVYYNYLEGRYYSAHKEPERITESKYFIAPTFTDISQTVNILPTGLQNTANIAEQVEVKNKNIYHLEKLYFVQRTESNVNQNILGTINNIYWCSNPVTRYGEHTIDGNTYLVVPNAWENRKYHIKNYFSVLMGEEQSNTRQRSEIERLEKLSQAMNCVIKLDD